MTSIIYDLFNHSLIPRFVINSQVIRQISSFEMAEEIMMAFLQSGKASPEEIKDFVDWCMVICKDGSKPARYQAYTLWANILRGRRTPYKYGAHFIYDNALKNYLRTISGGDITDAEPPKGSVYITAESFVRYVIKHLDDGF